MTAPTLTVDRRPTAMPEGPPPAPGQGLPGQGEGAGAAPAPEPSHDLSDWCVTAVTWGGSWVADLTGDPTMRASRFELTTLRAVSRKLEDQGVLAIPGGWTSRRVLILALLVLVGAMLLVRAARLARRRPPRPRATPDEPAAGPPAPTHETPVRQPHVVGDGVAL